MCCLLSAVCNLFPQVSSSSNAQQLMTCRNVARNLWEHLLQQVFFTGTQTKRSSSGSNTNISRDHNPLPVAAFVEFIHKIKVLIVFIIYSDFTNHKNSLLKTAMLKAFLMNGM